MTTKRTNEELEQRIKATGSVFTGLAYRCRNDRDRTMEFASDGCFDITGYQPSDLIQNRKASYAQLIHPEDREHVWNDVQSAVQEKRRFRTFYRICTAAGKQKWVWDQGMGIYSPEGNLLALEGFVADISEQKTAEKKIERLNLVLRTIRNVNRLLVKQKNRAKLLQGICDNLVENRGYYNAWVALFDESGGLTETAEAGLGKQFLPFLKRLQDGDLTYCAWNVLSQSGPLTIEDPRSTCKGCPLSASYGGRGGIASRLKYGKKVFGIVCASIPKYFIADQEEQGLFKEIAGDIAFALHQIELNEQHKLTLEDLRRSEKRFRDLLESSLAGIGIIQDGQIVYKNTEQERLWGPSRVGDSLSAFKWVHPEDAEKVKHGFQQIATGKVPYVEMDLRFYPSHNTSTPRGMKWVHCRTSLIEYKGKEAILVNMMDFTRAKELENLLRVEDKMASLGRVAAGIAHEIRNPLSGINIYLNTLGKIYAKPENLDKVKRILEQLQSASNKIDSVIRRVMDFSKPMAPRLVLTHINQPIEDALNLALVTLRKSGVKVEKSLSENLPKCLIDPHLIEEVILNLITNAAEAMKDMDEDKNIGVTSSREGDSIIVRIFDSGPGVSSGIQDKIFDPFYTTKNGSTGIGLSLAHRIITDHGGFLGVFKSEWGGAEFVIEIPVEEGTDQT